MSSKEIDCDILFRVAKYCWRKTSDNPTGVFLGCLPYYFQICVVVVVVLLSDKCINIFWKVCIVFSHFLYPLCSTLYDEGHATIPKLAEKLTLELVQHIEVNSSYIMMSLYLSGFMWIYRDYLQSVLLYALFECLSLCLEIHASSKRADWGKAGGDTHRSGEMWYRTPWWPKRTAVFSDRCESLKLKAIIVPHS